MRFWILFACVLSFASLSQPKLFQAYDKHLNMVLGNVEETITEVEVDPDTLEELIEVGARTTCTRRESEHALCQWLRMRSDVLYESVND